MTENLMKQIVFQAGNISHLFLSPYVDVVKDEGKILLKRHDRNNMIILELNAKNESIYMMLFEKLNTGAKEEEVMELLTAIFGDEADIWYENLIWEGVIE